MSLRRSDVVSNAVDLVSSDGAEGLGIALVARKLGIKAPSLYNHVTSNADLHHAVAVEGYNRLANFLAKRAASSRADGPDKHLRRLCHSFRDFAIKNPKLYTFFVTAPLDPMDPICLDATGRVLAPFESAIVALGYKRTEATHALRGLRAALQGFVALELSGQFHSTVSSTRRSFEFLLDQLVQPPKKERRA